MNFYLYYKAFDSLDKEYIQAILINLESVRRVSEDALIASNAAKLASDDALKANRSIEDVHKELKTKYKKLYSLLNGLVEKLNEKSIKINDLECICNKLSVKKNIKEKIIWRLSATAIFISIASLLFSLGVL